MSLLCPADVFMLSFNAGWIPVSHTEVLYGLFAIFFVSYMLVDTKLRYTDKDIAVEVPRTADYEETKPLVIQDSPEEKPSYAAVAKSESDSPTTPSRKKKNRKSLALQLEQAKVEDEEPQAGTEVVYKRVPANGPGVFKFLAGSRTTNSVFNGMTLLINFALLAACLDFHLSPYFFMGNQDLAFMRVGAITDSTAKIVARIPPHELIQEIYDNPAAIDNDTVSQAMHELIGEHQGAGRLLYRMSGLPGQWKSGPIAITTNESDYMTHFTLRDLYPATAYEYRIALPTHRMQIHPAFEKTQKFNTFPDPRLAREVAGEAGGTHFKFAAASCILPGWPYNLADRISAKGKLKMRGVEYLAENLKPRGIEWLMFVDFIYVDVPHYSGAVKETYLRKYRQVYASESWKKVYEVVPVLHIYDDHEILNDYSSNATTPVFQTANKAYQLYNGNGNHDVALAPSLNANYYWFRQADAAFFVWDTRMYRSPNKAKDDEDKTMLGETQKQVFIDWLATVNTTVTWKFVVSSIPFMTLWDSGSFSSDDTWAGFLHERSELMDIMQYVPNIIVISGDRHEWAMATIRNAVVEVSTSPLNQFYLPIHTFNQNHGLGKTGEDMAIKYIPEGNSKYTTFEVDTRIMNRPQVYIELNVDGQPVYNMTVIGKQVHAPKTKVGGMQKSLLELLSFIKRPWF